MGKTSILIPAVAAGAAFLILPKLIAGKNVAGAVKIDTELHKFTVTNAKPVIEVAVLIINPSLSKTSFKSLSGKIFYKDKAVGDITYMKDVDIPARTVTKILLPVKISILESISSVFLAILTNKNNQNKKPGQQQAVVDFTLKMDVWTSLGKFPYEKTFVINPSQPIIPK